MVTLDVQTAILIGSENKQYCGCKILQTKIVRYLWQLRRVLGDAQYSLYRANQRRRDSGQLHITVIKPLEFQVLSESNRCPPRGTSARVKLLGLGHTCDAINSCYYIVVDAPTLQQFRQSLGLVPAYFHITLGFHPHDVYNMPKDETTLISMAEYPQIHRIY